MSPRTSDQFGKMREEKSALIMDVALEHFANKGFHATTISHIARHAGISKGLLYNYFESKEALLNEIIRKSVEEVYGYFDIDRDEYLTEDEFEFFIRRAGVILNEKRSFWRLLFQLLMQNEVREEFQKSFLGTDSMVRSGLHPENHLYVTRIIKMVLDYFTRKSGTMEKGYDPLAEVHMFLITIRGFAITAIFSDDEDAENNDKAINRIIELFK